MSAVTPITDADPTVEEMGERVARFAGLQPAAVRNADATLG